jgi:chromosome segregation ATPase
MKNFTKTNLLININKLLKRKDFRPLSNPANLKNLNIKKVKYITQYSQTLTESQKKVLDRLNNQVQELSDQLKKKEEEIEEKELKIKELQKMVNEENQANQDLKSKIEEKTRAQDEKNKELDASKNKIQELESKNKELVNKIKSLDERDEKRVQELQVNERKIGELKDVIDEKETGIKELEAKLSHLEESEKRTRKIFEKDPKYKIFFILKDSGSRSFEELSKTLGITMVQLKTYVSDLNSHGLVNIKAEKLEVPEDFR